MGKMKTEFDIEGGFIEIWEETKNNSLVFIRICLSKETSQLSGKNLELFAVNILKALKSKKLNPKVKFQFPLTQ